MLRASRGLRIWGFDRKSRMKFPHEHQYGELTKYRNHQQGLAQYKLRQPRLKHPSQRFRFNPGFIGTSKNVGADEATQWHFQDQPFLPDLAPEGYTPPKPHGRRAWPAVWTEEFAQDILKLDEEALREFVFDTLTSVIHEECQRDGIELRRLDVEGVPMTELPTPDVIQHFSLEAPTLRDRVIERAVEESFGFTPDSAQRAAIVRVKDIIDFVVARVEACRIEKEVVVTDAVIDFLAEQDLQPEFGYQHVLPQDSRKEVVKEWEAMFHSPWQFGNAEFAPRDIEEDQLTPAFIEAESRIEAREQFNRDLESGELRRRHMEKIRAAAAA